MLENVWQKTATTDGRYGRLPGQDKTRTTVLSPLLAKASLLILFKYWYSSASSQVLPDQNKRGITLKHRLGFLKATVSSHSQDRLSMESGNSRWAWSRSIHVETELVGWKWRDGKVAIPTVTWLSATIGPIKGVFTFSFSEKVLHLKRLTGPWKKGFGSPTSLGFLEVIKAGT